MTVFNETVTIPADQAAMINEYLNHEPANESDCFNEDETFSKTVKFPDGAEMDIKLCGVQYLDGESNLPWTEAVLFINGSEVACSEPEDEFFGEWELEHDGTRYIANVKAASS